MKNHKAVTTLLAAVLSVGMIAGCGSKPSTQGTAQTEAPKSAAPTEKAQSVNLYTARTYEVDDALYAEFTKKTGIKVNVVKGNADELIERIKREGASTPADLFITVDGGLLSNAKLSGVLQPVKSDIVDQQVPKQFRDTDNQWIGIASRARIIAYSKARVKPEQLSTYEDLASEKWKGKVLVRSSTSLYNQSLLASLISLSDEQKAEAWAKGIVSNLGRNPEGGDRDQAKGIVAGAGDLAIMNTYYVGQMLNSKDPEEVKAAQQIGVFFPNQSTTGTHLNISGIGLIKSSKNKDAAVKFIEYLTGEEAQTRMSMENFEFPVNAKAQMPELLKSWGEFKTQQLDFSKLGENNKKAVEIMNKVGWK